MFTLFDNQNIQVNAYLFSTNTIPTVAYNSASPPANNPQYGGNASYQATFSWTHKILITKRPGCQFAYPPLDGWFVPLNMAATTNYVVRSD